LDLKKYEGKIKSVIPQRIEGKLGQAYYDEKTKKGEENIR